MKHVLLLVVAMLLLGACGPSETILDRCVIHKEKLEGNKTLVLYLYGNNHTRASLSRWYATEAIAPSGQLLEEFPDTGAPYIRQWYSLLGDEGNDDYFLTYGGNKDGNQTRIVLRDGEELRYHIDCP